MRFVWLALAVFLLAVSLIDLFTADTCEPGAELSPDCPALVK